MSRMNIFFIETLIKSVYFNNPIWIFFKNQPIVTLTENIFWIWASKAASFPNYFQNT